MSSDPDLVLAQITALSEERGALWDLPVRTEAQVRRITQIGAQLDQLFAARRRVQALASAARSEALEAAERQRSEDRARTRAARALVALRGAA